MCANPVKRTSSFRIEDILLTNKKTNNYNIEYEINNNGYEKNKLIINKEIETETIINKRHEFNKYIESSDLLRKTLLSKEEIGINNNKINKYYNMNINNNLYPEDLSKKSQSEKKRNNIMLDHNERTSAFKGVESYSGRPSSHSSFPTSRFSYPGSGSYMDAYGTPFESGIPPSSNHWAMHPALYNYSSTYPHASYPPYFPPSYLRPYPLPLSLSFPLSYSKRKGGQVRFTPQQTQNLERRFGSHQYLSPEDRRILADQLKLTDRQVKTWFQNRRAKWRRTKNTSSSDGQDDCEMQSDDELSSGSNECSMFRSPNSPISVG